MFILAVFACVVAHEFGHGLSPHGAYGIQDTRPSLPSAHRQSGRALGAHARGAAAGNSSIGGSLAPAVTS